MEMGLRGRNDRSSEILRPLRLEATKPRSETELGFREKVVLGKQTRPEEAFPRNTPSVADAAMSFLSLSFGFVICLMFSVFRVFSLFG